ncbi:MAG: TlyA family RNA methyltransferase, partial [Terriglobales bacterium]
MAPSPGRRTPPPKQQRLDRLLVARGLAETRQQAQALILAGQVLVAGQKRDKAGAAVAADAELRILGAAAAPYVSRGGVKLAAALDAFSIFPTDRVCVDVGASTGGFTDCLLQRGARHVYALDTGHGQLHWRLRQDPRVVLREKCNVRYLRPADIPEPVSLIVVDVAFISVTLLLPALAPLLAAAGGDMIVLVKPQFEAGKGQVGKGGIVRTEAVRQAAVA